MPFNGGGTFTRVYSWVVDAANGIFVSSSRTDTDTDDIANGLSNCVTRDGQSPPTANIPMGGFKLTGLAAGITAGDSVRFEQLANALPYGLVEGRLTLTTGVPITTADVLAAETLYFTPYRGNRITLFSSGAWAAQTFTEISIDVPDVTSVHDVFAYNNSGTVTLEVLAWTNDTTRAVALTTQDGVYVKTGDPTRRYLGTFYSTTAGNGQIEDSYANRYLFNYYNQVDRPGRILFAGTWTYNSATVRQANNSTANQVNFVIGVAENPVRAYEQMCLQTTGVEAAPGYVVIGLDSATAAATGSTCSGISNAGTPNNTVVSVSEFFGFVGVGRHYLSALESGEASSTTFRGASPPDASGLFVDLQG